VSSAPYEPYEKVYMALLHPTEDPENRTPVWLAMSEFFLDTELTEVTISYIARICAASPYSMGELERIMFIEVYPAFVSNLLSVAGEWAGWSEDFVRKRVLETYKPRLYLPWRMNPIKRFWCKEWPDVERRIVEYRNSKVSQTSQTESA
jgi:hypothetical protein